MMPDLPSPERLAFIVRTLVRQADRAALGTLLDGATVPYVSLVGVASDIDGTPILLLSRLAEHTRAILKNPQVSLLIDGTAGFVNPQQGPRVSLLGRLVCDGDERLRRRFLARHPAAALYAGFADFSFFKLIVERSHWVGGFGRAQWVAPQPACDDALTRQFDQALPDLQAAFESHPADVLGRIARHRLKMRGRVLRLVGVDPDGCDLAAGEKIRRLSFEYPLDSPDKVLKILIDLAEKVSG
jgi:putative heme iron utilization protein